MTQRAKGEFEVKLASLPAYENAAFDALGRISLDKQYHGALEATARGQMLTASTPVKGSGVYVAIEQVSGTLDGRSGTFVLHHTGVMTRGNPELSIAVVPDSGTGLLAGLSGRMSIEITDGKHFYTFDYSLDGAGVEAGG